MSESELIQQAILTLEQQREQLGATVADTAILALREKITRLRLPPTIKEQRKQITVLFADITDFTQLSEHLDAEEITELLSLLWGRIDRIILQRGGRIDKHMGDSVMAFWGADQAREDDAEQALLAALDIKRLIQELRPQVKIPIPLDFCIGISTGSVVLSTLSTTGEYTAIGPTVNLAYRLEGIAPPGGILISHDTYQHVRGLFQGHALPPLNLKGFAEPVQAYQIIEALPFIQPGQTRNAEGVTAHMIGRRTELEQLQQVYRQVEEQQHPVVIHVTGEAGIGKSRLVHEFEQWAMQCSPRPQLFKGRARQETRTSPYALLRDMFSLRFGIYENDHTNIVKAKLERGFSECMRDPPLAAGQSHFVGELLGFEIADSPYLRSLECDPAQLRHRAMLALGRFFQASCAHQVTVLQLEDTQWADSSSLQLLNDLINQLMQAPLLVISVTRTEGEHNIVLPTLGAVSQQQLRLRPLNRKDSQRLIAAILEKLPTLPEALEELIISKAEGNPFYIEELIQTLIEERIILKSTPYWQIDTGRLISLSVPPTLTGLLQARLDALPKAAQEVLQCAAVIGPIFWSAAVEAVASTDGKFSGHAINTYDAQLEFLCHRGIIVRNPASTFTGTQEFSFKHAIMHAVVYECTLHRLRRLYHARAARWLSSHNEKRAGEFSGRIAEHLLSAGAATEAVKALHQAGQHAAARFANEQAASYFMRALALTTEEDSAQRCALYLDLEAVHEITGDRQAQEQTLTALKRLTEMTADDHCQLELALRQAAFFEAICDYPTAVEAAQCAIQLAQSLAAPCHEADGYLRWGRILCLQGHYQLSQQKLEHARAALHPLIQQGAASCAEVVSSHAQSVLADTLRNLGNTHWHLSDYQPARACYESALQHYRELQNIRGAARCLSNLGILASDNSPHEALALYRQALALYREIGSRYDEANTLNNLAILQNFNGELEAAHASYLQVLELRRATKDRLGETIALSNLGSLALQRGDFEEARTCYERSFQINREIGNLQGIAGNLGNLGIVALERGDYSAARTLLQQALVQTQELGLRHAESDNLFSLCQLHRECGALMKARNYGEQALQIARELQYRFTEADVLVELGYIHQALGHADAAREAFEKVIEIFNAMGQPHLALEGRAALAQLALEPTQQDTATLTQARQDVTVILNALETQSAINISGLTKIYLACYRVLEALHDERANAVVERAYQILESCAAKLPDAAARRRFLEATPANQQLLTAWRARHG